ncbi:uncharacterized protein LOC134259217 [Saccostrea cucullata]|uniref:uncharacterized protein LOC134259217 n=1 Tax=Saccostrea cuccullata TaxID=36930 RepID=UPI002ED21A6D
MAELTAQGVGTSTKQAKPISEEAENVLWEKGLLGNNTGESMLNTVFFYNCKMFGLRAVDEHKTLSVNQWIVSKTREREIDKTSLPGRKSLQYLSGILQSGGDSENNRFYRRPLANGEKNEIRFSVQPTGINNLSTIMKNMCDKAGIPGFFSYHSGKRTCTTTHYQAGVSEQEIMERTGHRSIESVRKYKRPSEEMLCDISNALEPDEPVNKKAKSLDEIENPNYGDCECKNTFNNCQVLLNR